MSLKSCTDRLALYEGVAELCAGPHGCAYSVRHKTSKQLCTMHVVQWEDLNAGSEEANDVLKSHVLAEVELLVTHKHKHLATFVECFAASDVGKTLLATTDDSTSTSVLCYCIVTAAEDSTLQHIIDVNNDTGGRVSEKRIWKWVHQAVAALGHLHANGILHRQLRPESILIDHNDDLKLGRFGVTAMMTHELAIDPKNALSVAYMSPETLKDGTVDSKSDMWAMGCVFHELITLAHPFCLKEDLVLYDILNVGPPKILKKENDYSWHLRILPRWMMQKDAAFRPSALDVYFHVVCNWKDYSRDEASKAWVDEKFLPWTQEQLNDEENRFIFSAEMHIKAIECASATWEDVQERANLIKACGKTQTPREIGEERLAPVLRQGAPLIAAGDQ
jgi:serine/threonine protein kinase